MSDPKYPVERPDLTRLPWRALSVVAKVIESGDRKYHQGDWIMAPQRVDGRRDLASALRHIGEYVEGKDVDEDSGESPLAHAAARLLFLLEREARGIKGGGWRIAHVGRTHGPAAPCSFVARNAVQCRWFSCARESGHDGEHLFTRPYFIEERGL